MELARQEYPGLLSSLEPDQAVDLVNSRVALINKINGDIADWLTERRKIEEQYAQALRKLARRPQQDNAAALGVFQMPWQRIVSSTENLAQSHESLASKIQSDVESPLRSYHSTNREIQSMGNISGNLSAIAKDLTSAQKKAQKLDAKGSNKVDGARSSVEDASAQWESQAPFVFEQLQALDEGRVNHLRDVLTQFQTHELDAVEKQRASAEACLNSLLNVETADEIKTFALKARSHTGLTTVARRESLIGSSRPAGNVPPAPPPPRGSSTLEQRSSAVSAQDRLAPLPETPKDKKLSGLKRLGTVMGRRKSAVPPPPPSEKKKEKTRSFAPFRRQESSRSFQDLEQTGQDLSPTVSRDDRTSSRQDSERPPQTQESRASESLALPTLNGVSTRESDAPLPQIATLQPQATGPPTLSPPQSSPPDSNRRSFLPDPFAQPPDAQSPGEDSTRGFEIKDKPIQEDASEAQLAMSNIQNQLRLQAQTSGLNRVQGSVRGRRDVRNTMFIPNQQELPSPATPNLGAPDTPASVTTAPSSTTTGTTPGEIVSPVKRSLGTGTIPEDPSHAASDAHSIHSSHSMGGLGAYHTEMQSPGLNASIVETVNTWFSESGVTRSFVVGEVALAHNKTASSNSDKSIVRLQNFHQLEKCAQNPQFITPTTATDPQHQPGTYTIALSPISRPIPTVAFKYQLHLDSSNLSAASPILITQAWQIVEGQASVILMYSLNPAFSSIANQGSSPASATSQELSMKNVTVTVNLDTKASTSDPNTPAAAGPKALSAQMNPLQNATFKKRSSAVSWKFPTLTLKLTQERLLVRFMVENNTLAKKGTVEVKFEAPDTLASALGVETLGVEGTGAVEKEADPFADEGAEARKSAEKDGEGERWNDVQCRKVLVAGKYSISS